eukprot:SAG31_NODE_2173_length_6258_cov_2.493424_2_plen_51_part_00
MLAISAGNVTYNEWKEFIEMSNEDLSDMVEKNRAHRRKLTESTVNMKVRP